MLHTLALGMPGPFEWIIIAGLGLLIFGKRLPEVGRSLGRGIREFKDSVSGKITGEDEEDAPRRPAANSGAPTRSRRSARNCAATSRWPWNRPPRSRPRPACRPTNTCAFWENAPAAC